MASQDIRADSVPRKCSIDGCGRRVKGRGLCKTHYASEWRKKNMESVRNTHRKYRAEHPEKVKEYRDRWRAKHPDRVKEDHQKYYKNNTEKVRLRIEAWREENIDAVRDQRAACERKRRAVQRGAEGSHTRHDAALIRTKQKNKCAYCGNGLGRKGHLDHIIPLARGGSNWPRNLQWLCAPCNQSKNAKDPIEFAQQIGLLL